MSKADTQKVSFEKWRDTNGWRLLPTWKKNKKALLTKHGAYVLWLRAIYEKAMRNE